jgi:glycosyltransferase involved in cell wall biosynthesis
MSGLVIIPAHNEEEAVGSFLDELMEHLPQHHGVLIVNDGSSDDTGKVVTQKGFSCCQLPCNLGYTGALKTGLKIGLNQGADWMAFIDSDGQHRPEDLVAMIKKFEDHDIDILLGSRWMEHGPDQSSSAGRRAGMEFFSWIAQKLTGRRFTDTTNGLKILKPQVAKELCSRNFGDFHAETLIYLHDRGYKIEEHPIVVRARETGQSMYTFKDLVFYPLKNLILIAIFKLNSWTLAKVEGKR